MPGHVIIVIGASAGGVDALSTLVGALPAGLPSAVFLVLHVWPHSRSYLPDILQEVAQLPASHARDGESISRGRIFIAPPDRHLMLAPGTVRVTRGPREN